MQSADHLQEFLQDDHRNATDRERPLALTPARPMKTGIYVRSENGRVLRDRKVRRLFAKMRATVTWLQPSDYGSCRAWCELEILSAHVFADLIRNGATNASGDPRRLLSEYRGLRGVQLAYEKELGLTPAARAALGVQVKSLLGVSADEYARRQQEAQ